MLQIAHETLPQSGLSYFAFRLAFRETLERIALWKQFQGNPDEVFGFLTEVPFLREVPPHVQLDLLLDTWQKHLRPDSVPADLIDESVIYAVCETAARLVEEDPETVAAYLRKGPVEVRVKFDDSLASALRGLHLKLPNEGDFLLVGQFLDMPPEEADALKQEFRMQPDELDLLFEILGRWHVSRDFLAKLQGLTTEREAAAVAMILGLEVPSRG